MADPNYQPPKQFNQGRSLGSKTEVPKISGGGGQINTNWKNIEWTPKKLVTVTLILVAPYIVAVIGCFMAGSHLFGYILIGLAFFMGLILLALRAIDQSDF